MKKTIQKIKTTLLTALPLAIITLFYSCSNSDDNNLSDRNETKISFTMDGEFIEFKKNQIKYRPWESNNGDAGVGFIAENQSDRFYFSVMNDTIGCDQEILFSIEIYNQQGSFVPSPLENRCINVNNQDKLSGTFVGNVSLLRYTDYTSTYEPVVKNIPDGYFNINFADIELDNE